MFQGMTPKRIPTGEGQKGPEPERSLLDEFATWATAPLRKPLCKNLSAEFNALEGQAVSSVQAYMAVRMIEKRTNSFKEAIHTGGVAGVKAMIEAQRFIFNLRQRGLDAV